jgi:hypothetical protein
LRNRGKKKWKTLSDRVFRGFALCGIIWDELRSNKGVIAEECGGIRDNLNYKGKSSYWLLFPFGFG